MVRSMGNATKFSTTRNAPLFSNRTATESCVSQTETYSRISNALPNTLSTKPNFDYPPTPDPSPRWGRGIALLSPPTSYTQFRRPSQAGGCVVYNNARHG